MDVEGGLLDVVPCVPPALTGRPALKGYEILAEIPNPLQIGVLFCHVPAVGAAPDTGSARRSPPPPGVSMRSRWPGASVPVSLPGIAGRRSGRAPGRPGSPPSAPRGACRRRSAISEKRHLASACSSRTTPSPPRCAPAPPEPRRSAYSVTRSGNSRSSASIGRVEGVAHRDVHAARAVRVRARALAAAERLVVGERVGRRA